MKFIATLGAVAALALAAPVDAALLQFTISGDYAATFQLEQAPVPDFVDTGFPLFAIAHVAFPGTSAGFADITFFPGAFAGLLVSDSDTLDWLLDASGPQLYDGPVDAPRFKIGTFALDGLGTPGDFTLQIAYVPEPASWAMMIAGFGLAGAALRRRATSVRFQTA